MLLIMLLLRHKIRILILSSILMSKRNSHSNFGRRMLAAFAQNILACSMLLAEQG